MFVRIPSVLSAAQVAACCAVFEKAEWVQGGSTAGSLTKSVKHNMQIPAGHPAGRRLGEMILTALHQNKLFARAALPLKVVSPSFNRYTAGEFYGDHVDATAQHVWGTADRVRTDLSATLFLSAPEEYDGGELTIHD